MSEEEFSKEPIAPRRHNNLIEKVGAVAGIIANLHTPGVHEARNIVVTPIVEQYKVPSYNDRLPPNDIFKVSSFPSETEGEYIPQKDLVSGIEIYGLRENLKTPEQVARLYSYINRDFDAKLTNSIDPNWKIGLEDYKAREYVLGNDIRTLQIIVSRSMYDRFEVESQKSGINFADWMQAHVDRMNEMIEESAPGIHLKTVLSRIVVVNDSFDEDYEPHEDLPEVPKDIDAWWNVWWDFRGQVKNNAFHKSGYLHEEQYKDTSVILDYGLIHEWFHQLYNISDEYIQRVANVQGFPSLFLEGTDGLGNGDEIRGVNWRTRDIYTGYVLKKIKEMSLRGYFADPRGFGRAGHDSPLPETALKLSLEVPSESSMVFLDKNNRPLKGDLTLYKQNFINEDIYKEGEFEEIFHAKNVSTLAWDKSWLESQSSQRDDLGTTNWFIKLKTSRGDYSLHIPRMLFHLSALAGDDSPVFSVKFFQDPQIDSTTPSLPVEYTTQRMTMFSVQDVKERTNKDSYATIEIKKANAVFLYYWER